jgi:hypothetical protein
MASKLKRFLRLAYKVTSVVTTVRLLRRVARGLRRRVGSR